MPDLARYAPRFVVDGRVRDDIVADVVGLSIRQAIDELARFELTLVDAPRPDDQGGRFKYADDETLEVGGAIELSIGYADRPGVGVMMIGEITALDPTFPATGPSTFTIRGIERPPHARRTVTPDDDPTVSLVRGEELADAVLSRSARDFITGTGTALGRPDLRPGVTIALAGLGERFSGDYYVTKVDHAIAADGYRTTFDVRRGTP